MDEELRLEAQRYMKKNYLKSFSALVRYALLMLLRNDKTVKKRSN